ncbi:MAG: class I SAM-dependent methyltransferase [Candidatus Limnocylindrales bacterium]
MDDYELIDVGGGARLERFGDHITDRPHGGAFADRREPRRWAEADLRFDRDRGWSGPGVASAGMDWAVRIHDIAMHLRPTDAGQVGLFPEHAAMLPWLVDRVATRRAQARVLNLFAYTGLVTLVLARAGASVAHVDAARSTVAWARRNAEANRLDDRPIRWLVDDVRSFVGREVRRGRRYDGVVLDPPTYGHGARGGAAWRLEIDLPALLQDVRRLLVPHGFVVLTAHAGSVAPGDLGAALEGVAPDVEVGDLRLDAATGADLSLGAYARVAGT